MRRAVTSAPPLPVAARALDDPQVPKARRARGRRLGEHVIHEQRERRCHGPSCTKTRGRFRHFDFWNRFQLTVVHMAVCFLLDAHFFAYSAPLFFVLFHM